MIKEEDRLNNSILRRSVAATKIKKGTHIL
jgi:hypothetical protein